MERSLLIRRMEERNKVLDRWKKVDYSCYIKVNIAPQTDD